MVFLLEKDKKMGKSLGNVLDPDIYYQNTVKKLLDGIYLKILNWDKMVIFKIKDL